jgi:hypothetical protein
MDVICIFQMPILVLMIDVSLKGKKCWVLSYKIPNQSQSDPHVGYLCFVSKCCLDWV